MATAKAIIVTVVHDTFVFLTTDNVFSHHCHQEALIYCIGYEGAFNHCWKSTFVFNIHLK